MMREALAEKIRGRIEEDGVALIPAEDVWGALTAGDDGPLSVDDALTAFAASNGWAVEAKGPSLSPAFIFRERGEASRRKAERSDRRNKGAEEVSDKDVDEVRCTPTDPSLEFDVFEAVRLRLVEALVAAGHGVIDAERVALYVVKAVRPASSLLKVATREQTPEQGEVLDAVSRVLDEAATLEKARQIMFRDSEEGSGVG